MLKYNVIIQWKNMCVLNQKGCYCIVFWSPTSSMVSSCGVAALSSESFCKPASAFLRTSRLFLCLCASFFTWPSALPLLSRLTGLVSHLRRVFPGRLGPGELCKWPGCSVALPESPPSLLETESVSSQKEGEREKEREVVFTCLAGPFSGYFYFIEQLKTASMSS